ncbi:uncharacterized protein LOC124929109 [Impatiens glandulifera]|uniref:uncharacterized protein LOC124929109 n=1 Tax=Impatiens glandulifera TaxID=253017 RepID=UPI001FB1763B|nr:uncharacterized protein LOC124929109 [Impatiens glandulifera]
MATQKEHIEKIRRDKFSIGGEANSLRDDLNNAVTYLSTELYAKDVHFLMELIQNAEDNEYDEEISPSLEFVITAQDITNTGAAATLLIFNNEKGFLPKNIESICSVGSSTKKGKRKQGYIGEKGIGFKSVFLITQRPYIFSNGYQIRFNEEPCSDCNVRYIVPEWVDDYPTISTIQKIYGSKTRLPTTTIVLPLKDDKITPVKNQLSTIHPELLLFLSKIRKLSVKEDCDDPGLRTITSISIASETNFLSRKNIDADSYLLHLSSDEEGECGYHMWRQRFPVKPEHRVDVRKEVEEWVLTLSFPIGKRLNRGMNSPGVYAFLPTEMCSNFPFIVQADFILASSRETILMDNKWNKGILGCVPTAFVNAFCSMVKTSEEDTPVSTLVSMFDFLPINSSSYSVLNDVREKIKAKLVEESIVPCESYTRQRCFNKPSEVGRLKSDFRGILVKAEKQGVSLQSISSHGKYILNSSFDKPKHNDVLDFLGLKQVEAEWYVKFIRGSNLIMGVSDEVYLEILHFIAKHWNSQFRNSSLNDIPILKYVSLHGDVSLFTLNQALKNYYVYFSSKCDQISWLIDWNKEIRCQENMVFMPMLTQQLLLQSSNKKEILDWLMSKGDVREMDVGLYASHLISNINNDKKLAFSFMHFLYHSHSQGYLADQDIRKLCSQVPIVNNYGNIHANCKGILVPAHGSKWVGLLGANPWKEEGYIELSESYLASGLYAGKRTASNEIMQFLKNYFAAADLPFISPPATTIPTMSGPLTNENAFLVFKWIRYLRRNRVGMPEKFLNCIKNGNWMKISFGGSSGYRSPSQSFLPSSSWGYLLQLEDSFLVDIPIIDMKFYGDEIVEYKDELKQIGVMFEYGEACEYAGKHLMTLAASSSLTKENAFSILKLIRFLREKMLSPVDFINSVKDGRWLRTSKGVRSPVGSVLFSQEWKVASQISDIPFIDQDYYGQEILSFKSELELLGVIVQFNNNYKLVADCLKSSGSFGSLSADCTLLMLNCIRNLTFNNGIIDALKGKKILKTNKGYMSPAESYLLHSKWGSLLQVFNVFPLIDVDFYGRTISSYESELKVIGVKVDFETACKEFGCKFKDLASKNCISRDNVLSFLECWRRLTDLGYRFPEDLKSSIKNVKWLRTTLCDYRLPKECILFGAEWESISAIARLPFVDDSEEYYGKAIHNYTKELKNIGVNTSFKDCYRFVFEGLSLISNPWNITPANVYSLLESIRNSQLQNEPLSESLMKKLNKKWIKTTAGYQSPKEFLFFDSKMNCLKRLDGPFIDEEFYGPKITSYMDEFRALGYSSNISLLARHLEFHSNLETIIRVYSYLKNCNWECGDDRSVKIWIPIDSENGKWVAAEDCVISDSDDLFGTSFNVLEKFYDKNLQDFFSNAFKVKCHPSLDDYLRLWKSWEGSRETLSHVECFAFWRVVHKNWCLKTEKTLTDELVKLPVYSGLSDIILCPKEDVFIADDLQLKDLFQHTCSKPLFVWYPEPSSSSILPWEKMLSIYRKIGVRTITECVIKDDSSILDEVKLEQVASSKIFICKGLLKLILGFLGNSSLKMDLKERHKSVTSLLNATVFQTEEPVTMSYSLPLSNGENVSASMTRMIGWDRENSKLFYQKRDGSSGGYKGDIEFATYYSETVSEGLLWEHNEDQKSQLAELIKLGMLLKFDEDAIDFLMKTKNLHRFSEDDEFLSLSFSSGSPE